MSDCGEKCANKSKLLDSLKDCIDSVLGVRDCVGAVLHPVSILTRVWDGERPGDGTATEETEEIKPSPEIVDYGHDIRLMEGGAVKQGDIIIRGISKNKYPDESMVDCRLLEGEGINTERFYFINDRFYTVIHVKDKYLTWDVHLRKRSDETRQGQ